MKDLHYTCQINSEGSSQLYYYEDIVNSQLSEIKIGRPRYDFEVKLKSQLANLWRYFSTAVDVYMYLRVFCKMESKNNVE